jgi:hypothetical protein
LCGATPSEGAIFLILLTNMKKIFLIIFLGSLLFPLISLAGTYIADGTDVCYEGLVPCGKEVQVGGSWVGGKCIGGTPTFIRCQFCHFFVMLDGAIDFVLFKLVPPIAILMLVIGGVMFILGYFGGPELLEGGGKGGPKMFSQGKKLITSVFIGLIIMFAAWLIINLFFQFIGVADWTGLQQGWFRINCPIELPRP